MNKRGLLGTMLAACVGCLALVGATHADAAPPKKKADETKVEPGKLEVSPKITPKGVRFGLSPKELGKLYEAVIEKDFIKRYKQVEPGIQMQRLDYEKSQKKAEFRLSYVPFDSPPGSLDGTKLVTEFTYYNGEGMMKIERRGKQRFFFFIKEKLWNIVDAYPLKEGGKFGADFKAGVAKVERMVGVPGVHADAEPDAGMPYEMVHWNDGKIWLRVMNWGTDKIAISYVDMDTAKRLQELRKNKGKPKDEIDQKVKDVLR